MKKLILALIMVGVMMTVTVSYSYDSYETYKQAFDAGMAKSKAKDYAGARTDFMEALNLATVAEEKAKAQLRIGETYFAEEDYPIARTEYAKVLDIVDAHFNYKSDAQLRIGHIYCGEKNYSQARVEYAKILEMEEAHPHNKSAAQLHIGHTYYQERNYSQARIEYAKVLKMVDGHSAHKSDAQRCLKQLKGIKGEDVY